MDWKWIVGLAWTSRVSYSELKAAQRQSNSPNSQIFLFKRSEPHSEFHNQSPVKSHKNKGQVPSSLKYLDIKIFGLTKNDTNVTANYTVVTKGIEVYNADVRAAQQHFRKITSL